MKKIFPYQFSSSDMNLHHLIYSSLLVSFYLFSPVENLFAKVYNNLGVIDQYQGPLDASDVNQKLLRVGLNVANGGGSPTCSGMTFNITGFGDVAGAKLYYTAQSATFSTATQLDITKTGPFGATVAFAFAAMDNSTANGLWYYWLVIDMNATITAGTTVDASYNTGTYTAGPPGFNTTNPSGFRLTGRNYLIGSTVAEQYTNVKAAADAIAQFDYDGASPDIVMELTANYPGATPDIAAITFTNHTGPAKIIIRPQTGQTGKVTALDPGNGIALITFDGAQNITFDGRPGGTGTIRQWAIRNTRATVTIGPTLTLINAGSNNTFQYLNIEGEVDPAAGGIVVISTSTAAAGNENISFKDCYIGDLTAGGTIYFPHKGIFSSGTAGKPNRNITIDSCLFVDNFFAAIAGSATISVSANSDTWTIINNHFYQLAASYDDLNNPYSMISIGTGSGFTVSGNFIGGTAINCGGTPMTLSSPGTGDDFRGISFGTTVSGTNTVNGNTIANIAYTTATTAILYPFVGIALQGTANYTCGSLGNGNTIGSMSATGSITVTNNAASGSLGFVGIYQNSSGVVSIGYNNIGGITVQGSRINASCDLIGFGTALGTVTIQNNTLGGAVANSISVLSDSPLSGIYNGSNTNGMTCNNNIIQNFNHSAATTHTSVNGIANLSGPFTCTGNTIKNINTPSDNSHYAIRHQGTTATISSNTIQDVALSNTGASTRLYGIFVNTASAVTCNSNTIGNTTINNITIAGDGQSFAIYKTGTGTFTCNNNVIQEIYMSGTGINASLYTFSHFAGQLNATGNIIRNLTVVSRINTFISLIGIYCGTISTGNVITKNQVYNLNNNNTNPDNTAVIGIYQSGAGSSGSINKNFIYGLKCLSSELGSDITGIQVIDGTWDIVNNVVLLDNAPTLIDRLIYGIHEQAATTTNIYHNTVKISGNAPVAGTAITRAFYRDGAGTDNILNNIFQNVRTGSSNVHYAEYAALGGIYNSNYNYLEVSDNPGLKLCNYGGADYNLAGWQGAPVNAANSISGTTILDANGYAPPSFVGANAGIDLFTPTIVVDDKTDLSRDAAPWMGAYEGGTGNMVYVSSTADHFNEFSEMLKGSLHNQILGVQIVMQNPDNPLPVTSFTFNTNGTTNPTVDIQNAKLWTTGQSSAFGTTTQLGLTVANPNGVFSFSGFTYTLNAGNNYFWLTYDIQTTATIGNYCDAECTSLIVDGIARTPTTTAPAGSRPIGISWIGVTSINWNTTSNWANNQIPVTTTDVFIPAGTPFAPTISTNASCRDINIKSGATVTNNVGVAQYFNIYGNLINDGNYNDAAASTYTRLYGGSPSTWGGSGTYLNGVTIVGNFEVMASADISIAGNITIDNLTINANGKLSLNNYTCITQTDFTQNGNFNANSGILESWGTGNLTAASTDWGTGTLFLNHSFNLPFFTADDYYNIKIANPSFTTTIGTNLDIKNNFEISGATTTVDGSSYTLKVGGNWINNGIFTPSTSTVALNGAAQQNLGGASSTIFNNLTINNTSATGVIVQTACTVNTALTLTDGILNTDNFGTYIYLSSTTSVSPVGGSAVSYVDGFIQKNGTTAFIFPTVDGSKWRRIAIGVPTASSTFRAKYFNSGFGTYTLDGITGLTDVSQGEYWILDRMAGTGQATVSLYFEDASQSGIDDCADLRIAHWSAINSWWENNNDAVTTTSAGCPSPTTQSGNIVTNANVTSFSPFTFGSKSLLVNPLGFILGLTTSITATNVSCFGDNNGSADLTVSGGTPPYTYNWSTGALTEDIAGLTAGTYTVTVSDAVSDVVIDNVTIIQPPAIFITETHTDVSCTGSNNGSIDITATNGILPYTYAWDDGPTIEDRTNLIAGNYTVTVTESGGTGAFWSENFNNGCAVGCYASAYSGANGAWDVTSPGVNGANPNQWFVSCAENGNAVGACGTGCGSNATLHVGGNPGSYGACMFCGALNEDCGATYDDSNFNLCAGGSPQTDRRAESPAINCTGRTGITLAFKYIENGQGVVDNATIWYYNGSVWAQIDDPPKTVLCGGQGTWTTRSVALPSSADNNANIKIGFRWVNDADGNGADPSFAVDDVTLNTIGSSCSSIASISITEPASALSVTETHTDVTCPGGSNGAINITVGGGTIPYTYAWNDGPVTEDRATLTAGNYSVTVTDASSCTAGIAVTITQPSNKWVVTSAVNGTTIDGVSLRWAIMQANITCGHDTIIFNLGAGGPFTINLTSALPNLTDNYGATINGWENGAFDGTPNAVAVFNATIGTPMNAVYKIILANGNNIPTGLILASDSNIIQGLVLKDFGDAILSNNNIAITISGDDNKVLGCYIGMNVNGTIQGGTKTTIGIAISGANNQIGNGTAAGANLISGMNGNFSFNSSCGVLVTLAVATGNTIKGNMIGLQKDGSTVVASALQTYGVYISSGATGNKVGDIGAGEGNVISGNATFILPSMGVGVYLGTSVAGGNSILGNIIGPRADGTNWVTSNGQSTGIQISNSPDNIIGGNTVAARNIISANEDNGVYITGGISTGNLVMGNKIGVSSVSTFIANSDQGIGVFIDNSAVNNIIGGSGAGEGNIVSGQKSGIGFATGIYLNSSAASGNKVLGNIIGPMSDGITILASNAQVIGINIDNSPNNTIGGSTINERNIISANFTYGVYIAGASSAGNVVTGNYIGPGSGLATITGSSQDYGVYLVSSAANNTIGDTMGGEANIIAYNTTNGVYLTGVLTTGNLITRNPIYSNTGKPINLNYGAGAANNGNPAPVISTAIATTVTGTSAANDTIEVFKNTTTNCFDAVTFVGQTTADGSGNWSLTGLSLSSGDFVLATASDAGNNTSEFSGCMAVVVNIIITETHVNVLCNGGNNGSIDITVSNGTFPYTYAWNDGPITEDRTNLTAGTYTVTVTDALLEVATKIVTITQPALSLSVSETHTDVTCPGGSNSAINITAGGGTIPYTYSWNDGPVTEDRATLAAGTYTVTVTDANNCTATSTIIINTINTNSTNPSASAAPATICNGSSSTLSVTGGSLGSGALWKWYSGSCGGTPEGVGVGISVSPASTTTYFVRAEGTCNTTACASVTVTVNSNPTPTITPDGPTTFCAGGSVILSSSAASSYSWSTLEITQNITVTGSGTYTVTVTDGNGCTGTTSQAVIVNPLPVTSSITGTSIVCESASGIVYSVTNTPGSTYTWTIPLGASITSGAGTNAITVTFGSYPGDFKITETDANGCVGVIVKF